MPTTAPPTSPRSSRTQTPSIPHLPHKKARDTFGHGFWNPEETARLLSVRLPENVPQARHAVPFPHDIVKAPRDAILMPSFGLTIQGLREAAIKQGVEVTLYTSVANAALLNSQWTSDCWHLINTKPTSQLHRREDRGCVWGTPTIGDALQFALVGLMIPEWKDVVTTQTFSSPSYFLPPKVTGAARPTFYLWIEEGNVIVADAEHHTNGPQRTLQCVRPPADWVTLLAGTTP